MQRLLSAFSVYELARLINEELSKGSHMVPGSIQYVAKPLPSKKGYQEYDTYAYALIETREEPT